MKNISAVALIEIKIWIILCKNRAVFEKEKYDNVFLKQEYQGNDKQFV